MSTALIVRRGSSLLTGINGNIKTITSGESIQSGDFVSIRREPDVLNTSTYKPSVSIYISTLYLQLRPDVVIRLNGYTGYMCYRLEGDTLLYSDVVSLPSDLGNIRRIYSLEPIDENRFLMAYWVDNNGTSYMYAVVVTYDDATNKLVFGTKVQIATQYYNSQGYICAACRLGDTNKFLYYWHLISNERRAVYLTVEGTTITVSASIVIATNEWSSSSYNIDLKYSHKSGNDYYCVFSTINNVSSSNDLTFSIYLFKANLTTISCDKVKYYTQSMINQNNTQMEFFKLSDGLFVFRYPNREYGFVWLSVSDTKIEKLTSIALNNSNYTTDNYWISNVDENHYAFVGAISNYTTSNAPVRVWIFRKGVCGASLVDQFDVIHSVVSGAVLGINMFMNKTHLITTSQVATNTMEVKVSKVKEVCYKSKGAIDGVALESKDASQQIKVVAL